MALLKTPLMAGFFNDKTARKLLCVRFLCPFLQGRKGPKGPAGLRSIKNKILLSPPLTRRLLAAQTKGGFLNEILFFIGAPMAAVSNGKRGKRRKQFSRYYQAIKHGTVEALEFAKEVYKAGTKRNKYVG